MNIKLFRDEILDRILLISRPNLRHILPTTTQQPMVGNGWRNHRRRLLRPSQIIESRISRLSHIRGSGIPFETKHVLQRRPRRRLLRRMHDLSLEIAMGSLHDLDIGAVFIFDVAIDLHVEGYVCGNDVEACLLQVLEALRGEGDAIEGSQVEETDYPISMSSMESYCIDRGSGHRDFEVLR
jgi:hypothetical protein